MLKDKLLIDLIENTPVCIKIFDKDKKLVFINKGGKVEHKLTDDFDVSKWDWLKTLTDEYQKKINNQLDLALSGQGGQVEFAHTQEGSQREWCLGVVTPISSEGGKVDYVLFYSVDITKFKNFLKDIEENSRKYKALIDATPLCIKWFDSRGSLVSINKHGREEHHLEDKSEEEIRQWKYMECIDPKYHQIVKESMMKALKGEGGEFDMEHVPGTSTGHFCHSNLVPVKGDGGQVEYVLFISRDVTKEKETEDKTERNTKELEQFKALTVERELKMIELKRSLQQALDEIKKLKG